MNNQMIEDVAYKVANAKLGEGPAVRCEGPTEYEIGLAREWTRRVLTAYNLDNRLIDALEPGDMVFRIATALVECGIYPGGRLVGFPKDAYLTWAKAALKASHHAELVEALEKCHKRLLVQPNRSTLDIEAIDAATAALSPLPNDEEG